MTRIDLADVQTIEKQILRYAELVDDGDFAGVADLLADAAYRGSGAPLQGRAEIEHWFERRVDTWRWVERTVKIRLVGDVSKHLRS